MPYALREFACSECGEETYRRAGPGAQVRCINCAVGRSVASQLQLRAKSGPFYQKWAEAIGRAIDQERVMAALAAEIDSIG